MKYVQVNIDKKRTPHSDTTDIFNCFKKKTKKQLRLNAELFCTLLVRFYAKVSFLTFSA